MSIVFVQIVTFDFTGRIILQEQVVVEAKECHEPASLVCLCHQRCLRNNFIQV